MEEELTVLQVPHDGHRLRALVFTQEPRPASLAAAKRARFIQNLKSNYQRLKEALDFVEHFAVVCQLSQPRIDAVRKARDEALEELSSEFAKRLRAYDGRAKGEPM